MIAPYPPHIEAAFLCADRAIRRGHRTRLIVERFDWGRSRYVSGRP